MTQPKKDGNLAICNNMGGPTGYYAEQCKSDRERQIPYNLTYMWNVKIKQKQNQIHRCREHFGGCQMGEGWGGR